MVDYPVVYGPNAVPVQFVCNVDENGDPTTVSLVSGPVTATDGAIATIGHTTDSETTPTVVGLLKLLSAQFAAGIPLPIVIQGVTIDGSQLASATVQNLILTAIQTADSTLSTMSSTLDSILSQVSSANPIRTPKGYQQIPAAAPTLHSLSVPAGATRCVIRPEGGAGFRWTDDAVTVPTLTVGMPCYSGESLVMDITGLSLMELYPLDAQTIINISYYA